MFRRHLLPEKFPRHRNFVVWKSVLRPGSAKPTKILFNPRTGQPAKSNDPETWGSFEEALQAFEAGGYDGIGFVFTKEAGFVGIDLDNCLTDGALKDWALPIVAAFETYTEKSPSGNGLHIIAEAALLGAGLKRAVDARGSIVPPNSALADGAEEMYDTGRFFTLTGDRFGDTTEINNCQDAVEAMERRLRGTLVAASASRSEPERAVTEGNRHNELLRHASRSHGIGMAAGDNLEDLRQFNQRNCSPPKPDHELRGIIDWLQTKPPGHRLTQRDYYDSRKVVNGGPEPAADAEAPENKQSVIDYAESLLAEILDGKPEAIWTDTLFAAMAAAGDIKQFDAKQRLKKHFKADFSVKEWDRRMKLAVGEIRHEQQKFSAYLLTADGVIKPCVANAIIMMAPLPLAYNSFSCRTVMTKESPWKTTGNWSDFDDTKAQEWCQLAGLAVPHPSMSAAAADALAKLKPFSPLVDYLYSKTWDKVPRLDAWLTDYLGVPDSLYVRKVASKWLISGVKRAVEPGCQADYTLVLEGGQGKRKSTALRVLASDQWFTDDIADIGSKDSAMQLQGNWIVEFSELASLKRADLETIKAFLTRRYDKFRPPYGRRTETFPRQNIFAASTNKDGWGMDDSGLRRFWPVKVGEIDIDGLAAARDQLWAEAVHRYKEHELTYFTEETEKLAIAEQKQRQDEDVWKDTVEAWLANPVERNGGGSFNITPKFYSTRGHIYMGDICWHCLGILERDWSSLHKLRITRILTLAGYVKEIASEDERESDGRRLNYWCRQ